MKIYFCGSIAGGRKFAGIYKEMIEYLQGLGHKVLSAHVGDVELSEDGEDLSPREIHDRDIAWIQMADAVIADVTNPSLGVGYEIRAAREFGKKVLAVNKDDGSVRISSMISGCLDVCGYGMYGWKAIFENFLKECDG